ncbi:hypothetical protein HK104_010348 [Borealophlyctis nickersoniae]|nr:hypothetical protein HK104_010348 [Borealophlyctis nickersoniae]
MMQPEEDDDARAKNSEKSWRGGAGGGGDGLGIPLADRARRAAGRRDMDDDDDDDGGYVDEFDDDELLEDIEGGRRRGYRGGEGGGPQGKLGKYMRNPWVLMCGLGSALTIIVLLSIAGSAPVSKDSQKDSRLLLPNITLGHIQNYTFFPETASFTWVKSDPDGSFMTQEGDNIVLRHLEFDNTTVLAALEDIVDPSGNPLYIRDVIPSADVNYLLVMTEREKGWRHSFFATYWIYNIETKKTIPLTASKSDKDIPDEIGSGKVALAVWSPSKHNVAWVRDNDLYVTVEASMEVRITTDGSKDIINGIADWVYEEEVFGAHEALWFSPAGTRIAYLKFNETQVPEYRLQLYMQSQNNYPKEVGVKYPKAGAPNPIVTLHIATPSSTNASSLSVPVTFDAKYLPDEDRLLTEVTWVSETALMVRMMNRVQDLQRLFLVEFQGEGEGGGWKGRVVRDETNADGAWFDKRQPLTFIPPSTAVGRQQGSYIEMIEDAQGYTHLAYFPTFDAGAPTTWLTSGTWEVTDVKGVDLDKGVVYYLSTEEGSTQRHLYSVHLDGSSKLKLTPPKNVTFAPVIPIFNETTPSEAEKGDGGKKGKVVGDVGMYEAEFTPGRGYYVLQYRGPDVPWVKVVKADGGFSRSAQDNAALRNELKKYALPQQRFITIPNDAGDEMNAKIVVPSNFDGSGKVKYPVLMRVYGGPASQLVAQTFNFDFMTAVASAGFVVLIVDGRGTGFKGRKYRATVSKKLGGVEVEDQVTAAKWLKELTFVDEKRIAVWGWSYGGYMTSKIIEANSGVFALGMAVAPVTDWRFYDSIYTERYMKTPQMNPTGYGISSVQKMEGFKNAKFLLVHGTGDDNVHFQNTASLIWALTNSHIRKYRVQMYTDADHSMQAHGVGAGFTEVYYLLWRFLMDGFGVGAEAG